MQDILDKQLAQLRAVVAELDAKLSELRDQRAKAVGGLDALETLYAQISRQMRERPAAVIAPPLDSHGNETSAGIRPVIIAAFHAAFRAYPKALNIEQLKEAAVHAGPVGESFRTSIYHHEKRGNLEKVGTGEFRATPKTAQIIGEPWPVGSFWVKGADETEAAPA